MTPEAVLLSACALLHIRDPAEFYALPELVRALWLEHAANLFSGAYERKRPAKAPGSGAAEAMAAQAAFVASKRGG